MQVSRADLQLQSRVKAAAQKGARSINKLIEEEIDNMSAVSSGRLFSPRSNHLCVEDTPLYLPPSAGLFPEGSPHAQVPCGLHTEAHHGQGR